MPRPRRILALTGFPLLIAAIVAAALLFRKPLWELFSSPEAVRDAVSTWGLAAPLVFIGAQIFQIVIFIVPGETVQIAAGFLFGLIIDSTFYNPGWASEASNDSRGSLSEAADNR